MGAGTTTGARRGDRAGRGNGSGEIDEVLMLTNAVAPDKLGGLERYVRELSASLVAKGMPVTVLTKQVNPGDPLDEVADDGVHIVRHRVPSKEKRTFAVQYPVYVSAGILRHLRTAGPRTLVHGHYAITSLPVSFGRRPYVYTFHAPVNKEMLSERGGSYALPGATQRTAVRGLRTAERHVVSRASRAVVLSRFMRDELGELSEASATTSCLIAGGIDTHWFSPGPRVRTAWAADADPLLFAARRLTARTGVTELVEAMPEVVARHPGARLAVAGDGHLRADIERRIVALGVGDHVRLLGRVSDEDLREWYRAADLTVTPTQELEGFGLSTAEALAVGTPALVTPVGANPELVQDLEARLVAGGATPAHLARAICRLVDEAGLLARLRGPARDHAHPRWSWGQVADRYLELYRTGVDR
jgi:glycosyltransferase involved in cell wall biosynthesis